MKVWLVGCLLAVLWVATGQVMAQNNSQGETIFREVCQVLQQNDSLADNELVHTTYQAMTFFREDAKGALQQSGTQLEVYVGKDKVYYSSSDITCMQDKKQTISIFPDSHRILVGKTNTAARKASIDGQWRKIVRDTLLTCATITECKSELLEGIPVYKLVFSIFPQRQILLGMRELIIWVDADSKITRQMEMVYPTGSTIEKTRMSFSVPKRIKVDSAPVPVSASALVWDSKGTLLPVWKGYEIVQTSK
ncbi:hypothetical protein [Xanthocytophaga agilis]|nr:hypothetical protein [Xanthocytophaga agilis]